MGVQSMVGSDFIVPFAMELVAVNVDIRRLKTSHRVGVLFGRILLFGHFGKDWGSGRSSRIGGSGGHCGLFRQAIAGRRNGLF